MPLFNKGPHVKRAVDSVLKQTFDQFELIIVNDASTDNSIAEVQKFNDGRIKVYHRNKPGPGGYAARNLGIAYASGSWITFLDADDEWYHDHLENVKVTIDCYPNTCFISSGYYISKGKNMRVDPYYAKYHTSGPHKLSIQGYLKCCLQNTRPVSTFTAVINNNSPVLKNLFPSEYEARRGGDLHAWLKMICFHKEMVWSNHLSGIYHQDSVNMVTKSAPSSKFLMSKEIFEDLATFLSTDEKCLLRLYFNQRLIKSWQNNRQRECENFRLLNCIFWPGVTIKTLGLLFEVILNKPIRKKLGMLRKKLK